MQARGLLEQIGADLEVVKWVRNGYEQVPRNWNLVTGRDVTKCDVMLSGTSNLEPGNGT